MKLAEQAESLLADVEALVERAAEVKALRAERGKELGAETAALLKRLDSALERLREIVATDETAAAVARELERFKASGEGRP